MSLKASKFLASSAPFSLEISEEIKDLQNMEEDLKNVAEKGVDGLYSLIKQNYSILDGLQKIMDLQKKEEDQNNVTLMYLNNVAEAGDINGLYSLIEQNPSILDDLDALQFVDNPLHIAARDGKADFAMEIANLKPSLARKLNQKGLSPMHLALQNGHESIARGLVRIDRELVRVKGRGGRTPLHEVTSTENLSLLCIFLDACPASVEDTTTQFETALHLAVKSSKWNAFSLLLKLLEMQNKSEILSRGDNDGNTVLHVATSENNHKFVKKLLWQNFQVNHRNTEGKTALDILLKQGKQGHKLERPFRRAGALRSDEILSDKRGIVRVMAEIRRRFFSWNFIGYLRYNPWIDSQESMRDTLLVVVGLIASATYQSGITPPVDKWPHKFKFYCYLFLNSLGFDVSLAMLMILTRGLPLQGVLAFALLSMWANYCYSMQIIAPQGHGLIFFLFGYVFPILSTFTCVLVWELVKKVKLAWKISYVDPAGEWLC